MVPSGSPLVGIADRAGYPVLTVPAGYGAENSSTGGDPIGVDFIGTADSEATLLDLGFAFEAATRTRLDGPTYMITAANLESFSGVASEVDQSMWRCVAGSAFYKPYECNPGEPESPPPTGGGHPLGEPHGPGHPFADPHRYGRPGFERGVGRHRAAVVRRTQPLGTLLNPNGSARSLAARSHVKDDRFGVLLDIDGVLHVGEEPIEGAHQALAELRELGAGVRLVTNTTSRSRREIVERLRRMGFTVSPEEVLTPAALAVRHCRERAYQSVTALVDERLREDLAELPGPAADTRTDAIVLGDLGDGFTPGLLNTAFRLLMDGAELVALQHNRYWRRADGLALDVGAYAAALEYASGREAIVVGKPAREFYMSAMAELGVQRAVMIGDDLEADVGGAMAAGLPGVLVRTGKYRDDALSARVTPTAIVDSIANVPALIARIPV